jgi:hypothetical protein
MTTFKASRPGCGVMLLEKNCVGRYYAEAEIGLLDQT